MEMFLYGMVTVWLLDFIGIIILLKYNDRLRQALRSRVQGILGVDELRRSIEGLRSEVSNCPHCYYDEEE